MVCPSNKLRILTLSGHRFPTCSCWFRHPQGDVRNGKLCSDVFLGADLVLLNEGTNRLGNLADILNTMTLNRIRMEWDNTRVRDLERRALPMNFDHLD